MADEPQETGQVIRMVGFGKAADPATTTVQSNAFAAEDEFKNYYLGAGQDAQIIEPPYNLKRLDRLCQENNALSPCIEAMVTNIDGTGFEFETDDNKDDGPEGEDPNLNHLWDFFNQPWPGESFITQRKSIRRDVHRIGNGYLEVIENAQDEILFARHVDGKTMRLCALSDPVTVETIVRRRGVDIKVNLQRRERRFAQKLEGKTLVYFKEFGSSRDLDKFTGQWAPKGTRLPMQRRATSIIHFTALPDAHTPYGVPLWISQLPSVLGSRKAEEFNLSFFDNGGVPPVLILLQGGSLSEKTREALDEKTSGPAAKLNRVQVVEVEPNGGSLTQANNARVTVERFGGERTSDSMFEEYDANAEKRVRRAFRLPPIFVGMSEDYSFATAFASYTVTEAQVFKPERDEFDEVLTISFIPALGFPGYRMRSKALSIKDGGQHLEAIGMARELNAVEPGELLNAINEAVGTTLKVSPDAPTLAEAKEEKRKESEANLAVLNSKAHPNGDPAGDHAPGGKAAAPTPVAAPKVTKSHEDKADTFRETMQSYSFLDIDIDPEGLAEIAGCTIAVMAANQLQKAHEPDCTCGAH